MKIENVEIIYKDKGDDPLRDPLNLGCDDEWHYTETVGVKVTLENGKQYGDWIANGSGTPFTSNEIVDAASLILNTVVSYVNEMGTESEEAEDG